MDFDFLEPVREKGFKELGVAVDAGKVSIFKLVTTPRKLEALIQGELQLRTEIHLTFGSDLLTYGLDKFLLIMKELMGRGDGPVISTLKYDVIRLKPSFTQEEMHKLEKLYYQKVNAPVGKFINALVPRVKKVRAFIKDADRVMDQEVREVAAKEIVERIRKTSADFGFDLDRITKRTGTLLGHMAEIIGEQDLPKMDVQEYQAVIRKKTAQQDVQTKPQLIIIQQGPSLRILGGSKLDAHFNDISPELLYDTLRRYLLTKIPRKDKKHKKI
ncbi:MAG: hypothetical protein HWN65_03030 [Candidatus Helarchaeota archaeon]|nr:hypothetical protein [Candidatus Helarchaeota archaeon]